MLELLNHFPPNNLLQLYIFTTTPLFNYNNKKVRVEFFNKAIWCWTLAVAGSCTCKLLCASLCNYDAICHHNTSSFCVVLQCSVTSFILFISFLYTQQPGHGDWKAAWETWHNVATTAAALVISMTGSYISGGGYSAGCAVGSPATPLLWVD